MSAQEPSVPMMYRQDANWMFFQFLWLTRGLEGVVDLVNLLPSSGDPTAHELAVSGDDGMNEVFHRFTERLTDGGVEDSGGGTIMYDPPSEQIAVSGPRTIQRNVGAFAMKRLYLRVDPGRTACVESEASDTMIVSYRPGVPGLDGSGSDWETMPTENATFTGEVVVVATNTEFDASFSIDVTDVVDEGEECDEEEQSTPEPADVPDLPCLAVCGPSDFYRARDQLFEWFADAVGA
jgi:hypothetical protein